MFRLLSYKQFIYLCCNGFGWQKWEIFFPFYNFAPFRFFNCSQFNSQFSPHFFCRCEAKSGWAAFMKRRSAVVKINSLADATPQEIQEHNDVCAICYQVKHSPL